MKPVLMRAVAFALVQLALRLTIAQGQTQPPDLTALKIEDLMNVDVTSASKKEQKLSRVPAAIYVITQEDIRRSAGKNIGDLLRMVPGLDVAQVNASVWAISARGFNGQYSNKLLVLVDGRTVYTPIFSGVYWETLDLDVDSIERIEIIRGPGAAVWGANAVNGVIDIITRNAHETQGGLGIVGSGTQVHASGTLRYGGKIGSRGAYRVFADSSDVGSFLTPEHQDGKDDWHRFHAGFRADGDVSARDSLTLEGETNRGNAGQLSDTIVSLQPPATAVLSLREQFSGWDVLGRWKHVISPASETSIQVYFDRTNRGDKTNGIGLNTFDVDFQHHTGWGSRQDLVWGLGYRVNSDDTAGILRISFSPPDLTTQVYSSFIQDQIAIVPQRLYVSLGAKFAHEYYNGFNWQPTARVTWTPNNRQMFWAAQSQAAHTPSRVDTAIRFNEAAYPGPGGQPILVSLFGNREHKNELLLASEAGFRKQISDTVAFDSTLFFNRYRDLESVEPGTPHLEASPSPEHLVQPYYLDNLIWGESHGLEMFARVKLASRWTISPGYTFLTMHLRKAATSLDTSTGPAAEGGFPSQQAQVRSLVNLAWHWQWTTSASFTGRLTAPGIPSYTRLDSNVVWQPWERISLAFGGQDLLREHHQDYSGPDLTVNPSLIPRSAFARITWQF